MRAQTAGIARSRRRRVAALLAIAAMIVAMWAWWSPAGALPTTTIAFPASPRGTTAWYQPLTYSGRTTLTGGTGSGLTTITITLPPGVGDVSILDVSQTSGLTPPSTPIAGSCTSTTPVAWTFNGLPGGTWN